MVNLMLNYSCAGYKSNFIRKLSAVFVYLKFFSSLFFRWLVVLLNVFLNGEDVFINKSGIRLK